MTPSPERAAVQLLRFGALYDFEFIRITGWKTDKAAVVLRDLEAQQRIVVERFPRGYRVRLHPSGPAPILA